MSGITQWFSGELILNGVRLPALEGVQIAAPENFDGGDLIANNIYPVNYVAGLQYPVISIPLRVTKEWFTAALLNAYFGLPNRTSPYYDVAAVGSLTFWGGPAGSGNGWTMPNVKVNTLHLGLSLGGTLEATLELMATTIAAATIVPTSTPFLTNWAKSQNVAHDLTNNPTRLDLTISNGLMVNDEIPSHSPLTGTFEHPTELNAGQFAVACTLMFQRHHVVIGGTPADGTPINWTIHPPGAVSGQDVVIQIANPLFQGRYAQSLRRPRQRIPLGVICRGTDAGAAQLSFTAA